MILAERDRSRWKHFGFHKDVNLALTMDEEQDSRFSSPGWARIEVIQSEAILL
jgi:hypothetical protein